MTAFYKIKNWHEFQHDKRPGRKMSFAKLFVDLMQSHDWIMGDDMTRLLIPILIMLACEKNGAIPNNPLYIKKRANLDHLPDLKPLIESGFLVPDEPKCDNNMTVSLADASKCSQEIAENSECAQMLADASKNQLARPQEEEKEKEEEIYIQDSLRSSCANSPPEDLKISRVPDKLAGFDYAKCVMIWNQAMRGTRIKRTRVGAESDKTRAVHIRKRLEYLTKHYGLPWEEAWAKYCQHIASCEYLATGQPWFDMEWATQSATNSTKILEGKYDNKLDKQPQNQPNETQRRLAQIAARYADKRPDQLDWSSPLGQSGIQAYPQITSGVYPHNESDFDPEIIDLQVTDGGAND